MGQLVPPTLGQAFDLLEKLGVKGLERPPRIDAAPEEDKEEPKTE
jgi:hypothetical protein